MQMPSGSARRSGSHRHEQRQQVFVAGVGTLASGLVGGLFGGGFSGGGGGGLSSGFNAGTSSAIDTGATGWGNAFGTNLSF